MSLLETIAQDAINGVQAKAGTWIPAAIAQGSKAVRGSPDVVKLPALAALQVIGDNQEVLSTTGGNTFALLVSHMALGQERLAELAWLRDTATFDERMASLDAAHQSEVTGVAQQAAQWAEVKRVALAVLETAGKIAIPLLLAAI